jgi:hypothetical protein
MGDRLIESGHDRLHVSFHGIRRETYEASMGNLSWEKNLANVNCFIELKRRRKANPPRLKITMVHTKAIDRELDEIREYWKSRGITFNIHAFENRSHHAVEERSLNVLPMRTLSDCDCLMEQAYILWTGDCVLCCVDCERTTVMENVATEGLLSVWQNVNYLRFRRNYLAGNVEGTLCAGCKVQDEVDFPTSQRDHWPNVCWGRGERLLSLGTVMPEYFQKRHLNRKDTSNTFNNIQMAQPLQLFRLQDKTEPGQKTKT